MQTQKLRFQQTTNGHHRHHPVRRLAETGLRVGTVTMGGDEQDGAAIHVARTAGEEEGPGLLRRRGRCP